MASLYQDSSGRWVIQFAAGANNKRQSIRLGKISKQAASKIAAGVEQAEDEMALLGALSADSLAWMKSVPVELRNRFASVGLLPRSQTSTVLQVFLSRFSESLSGSESMMNFYGNVTRNLADCYGGDTPTFSITEPEKFERHLRDKEGLADATIARRIRGAKKVWRWGQKNGFADSNPFTELKATDDPNSARQVHVPADTVAKIIASAPAGLDIIIALARFAGLRCPSEIQILKWSDVNWNAGTITIRSPKLRKHKNRTRVIPIFHDLKPYLRAAHDRADGEFVIGSEYVGVSGQMWTKDLAAILKALKIDRWPRLWQNLRASCESDLLDAGFAENVAAKWMGHSVAVQRRHYTPMNEENWRRAANRGALPTPADACPAGVSSENPNKREDSLGNCSNPKLLHGALIALDWINRGRFRARLKTLS